MNGNYFLYCMKTENNNTLAYKRTIAGKTNRSFIKPMKINRMIQKNVSETGKY